jgi:hypothetical protein
MKSRTAVQILLDEINFGLHLWSESEITDEEFFKGLIDAHKDALKFERKQIIKAHGSKLKNSKGDTNFEYWYTGEDYYNDTFKNTNDETI